MSTQTQHPWRTMFRTILQVGIPAVLTLGVVVPEIVAILLEETGTAMPDQLRAVLLAVSAVVVAASAILTRVMAIPRVDELLERVRVTAWLATEPRPRNSYRHHGDPNDVFPED